MSAAQCTKERCQTTEELDGTFSRGTCICVHVHILARARFWRAFRAGTSRGGVTKDQLKGIRDNSSLENEDLPSRRA